VDGDAQVLATSTGLEVVEVIVDQPQLVVVVEDTPAPSVVVLPDPEPQTIQVVVEEKLEPEVIEVHVEGDNGLSAYELAVLQGFIGTPEEWLASLVGPTGATGEQGPQGPAGSGTSFELTKGFASPSTLWVIDHGFGTYGVEVHCVDQNGDLIEGNVRYPSEDRVEVDFYYPTAGTARLFR